MIVFLIVFILIVILWVLLLSNFEMIAYNHGFLKAKKNAEKAKFFNFFIINIISAIIFLLLFVLLGKLFLSVCGILVLFLICFVYQVYEKRELQKILDDNDLFCIPFFCKLITTGILGIILFCFYYLIRIIQ